MKRTKGQRAQRGSGLILFVTILVMGFAWYATSALSKIVYGQVQRDNRTGIALKNAKEALLAYVAQSAFSTAELSPGRLPCPEAPSVVNNTATVSGTGNALYDGQTFDTVYGGYAAPFTTTTTPPASSPITCTGVGRLPWKTLGVKQIVDGYDEPLWYAVATGTWAWVNNGDALVLNPGITNQLTYDGTANSVVAVIIAPGEILNTTNASGTPSAGCARVNQTTRYTAASLSASNFLECGNASATYTTIGTSPWSNDRTISITAQEVMDAISAAVIDRMQRQVAPALSDWRVTTSNSDWGRSFLPYASNFTTPSLNDMCGDMNIVSGVGTTEGLLPTATVASGTCITSWEAGTATVTLIAGFSLSATSCTQSGTAMVCNFTLTGSGGLAKARISVTAPNIGTSFRAATRLTDISVSPAATVDNLTKSINQTTGKATVTVDVSKNPLGFFIAQAYTVTIPNLSDAAILTSDTRMTWWLNNGWQRYAYYSVANGATLKPTAACTNPGDAGCITVSGLDSSTGNTTDKRFVVLLTGRALTGQAQPSANVNDYLEAANANTVSSPRSFVNASTSNSGTAACTSAQAATGSCSFNDRIATCPFKQTPTSGAVTICN